MHDYHESMADSTSDNPFSVLGLPETYPLDRERIERAYRARLAGAHPDAGDSTGSSNDPATLNQARSIMLSDEQRASALLALLGGPKAADCKELPDGFLMDMMMQRQEIEEAIESGGEEDRAQWEQWGFEQRRAYRDRVKTMFESIAETPDESLLREVRVQLNAWRYVERLIEQLDPEYDPEQADFH